MIEKKWVYLFHEINSGSFQYNTEKESLEGLFGKQVQKHCRFSSPQKLPCIPGFFITTEACDDYLKGEEQTWRELWDQTRTAIKTVEQFSGKKFGNAENPLLLIARASSSSSMFSMMEPIIGVGINDKTVMGLAEYTGDLQFAFDMYRRFIWLLGLAIFDIPSEAFYDLLHYEAQGDSKRILTESEWKDIIERCKRVFKMHTGMDFPQAPYEQLRLAIKAGFGSSNSKRAAILERIPGFPQQAGELNNAICFKAMVFGNSGKNSGIGVVNSRNSSTGERCLYGHYLVDGNFIDPHHQNENTRSIQFLKQDIPEAFEQLVNICNQAELQFRDMQRIEFCIEKGHLWIQGIKPGERSTRAAVEIALDMADEGLISKEEAITSIQPDQIMEILYPQFDYEGEENIQALLLAMGKGASPGAAFGRVYFDADTVEQISKEEYVIFVRPYFSPEDIHGILSANGMLSLEGDPTSNPAQMARQLTKPYVTEVSSIEIDLEHRQIVLKDRVINEGDFISIDGGTGAVFQGAINLVEPTIHDEGNLFKLLEWADEICSHSGIRRGKDGVRLPGVQVWANADYPKDAWRGHSYGAKGIGLCRSERMLFEMELLPIVQRMILSKTADERKTALQMLLPAQINHFEGLFEAMDGNPVVIRLMDAPLIDFLPDEQDLLEDIITMRVRGETEGLTEKELLHVKITAMKDSNPLLGLRGVRLAIMFPEIVESQVRAIFEAAANVMLKGLHPEPYIMISMASHVNELDAILPRLEQMINGIMDEREVEIPYTLGVQLEIPRGAVTAGAMAEKTDFLSIDTNYLTQLAFGLSRNDSERNFLKKYLEDKILIKDPFKTLDTEGVGKLMRLAIQSGREKHSGMKVGVFGDHCCDLDTMIFLHEIGVDYVSCAPKQVPVARLAAAQAAVHHSRN